MRLADIPILRSGFFRLAKNLVTAPPKSQDALAILETGVVGIDPLPMRNTGFMEAVDPEVKKKWAAIHALKVQIFKDGLPTGRSAAIPISERSYKPLNPLGVMKQKDMEKLASLTEIARVAHAQARANAKADNPEKSLSTLVIQGGLIIIGLCIFFNYLQGC